jgi:hypothetical protein
MRILLPVAVLLAFAAVSGASIQLAAVGHDSRIDLSWRTWGQKTGEGWNIYRSEKREWPFQRLNSEPRTYAVFSDFLGENGKVFYYRIAGVDGASEVLTSEVARAVSRTMSDEELLSSVQEGTFRYFWDYGHRVSGLAREALGSGEKVTIGGSGFGVMAIVVGAERGFISRADAAERVLKILTFLETKASRYHGAWSHWLDGTSGKTLSFSQYDDGGDLVETAFMIQALLTARQYFIANETVETEIRTRATRLWNEVEWDWYLGDPKDNSSFGIGHRITHGRFSTRSGTIWMSA